MYTRLLTGPMFSGKTRRLVASLERYVIAKKHVAWFEPKCDTRGGSHGNYIAQRMLELKNSEYVHTYKVNKPSEIILLAENLANVLHEKHKTELDAIFIDEYHMLDFKRSFFYDYNKSNLKDIPLTFSGLIVGCDAIVLHTAEEILPFIDSIEKDNAICMDCGKSANYYIYIGNWGMDKRIDTGTNYKCLCHNCYMKETKKPIEHKED